MKPSILYVEDEPFLAKIVKETLEQKSFNVIHVNHGSKAIETFQNQSIDLCVLDIMLPGKNGYDIAKEIRSIQADIPILFLSAKNQTEDVVKGFGVGGNDYVRKPFSMEELIARINNLLSISQKETNDVKNAASLKIGTQYEFFPSKLELHSNNGIKVLSHKETMILDTLCQNKNGVTERKDILLKAWGDDSFYNSRNLDVYITKLRSYLADDEEVKIITLKGVGYQFKC